MTLVNTAVWHIYTWKREWKPTPRQKKHEIKKSTKIKKI